MVLSRGFAISSAMLTRRKIQENRSAPGYELPKELVQVIFNPFLNPKVMNTHKLNPYQLLFFNREINIGNSKSNTLKGSAVLEGLDYIKLYSSLSEVLTKSSWTFLKIDNEDKSWSLREEWNGSLEEYEHIPEIAIDGKLWSVQLFRDADNFLILHVYLHHCLGDAHSFNLFWNAVFRQYQEGQFEALHLFPDLKFSSGLINYADKQLPNDLGIGEVERISLKFNSRIQQHLNAYAEKTGTSLMALLLEFIEIELKNCEADLEIPLKLGIALRNRQNKFQKNSFPTLVNFLPLSEDRSVGMPQRMLNLFRYQDYPLLEFLNDSNAVRAFNVLFSYQKETYSHRPDEFVSKFNFEPTSTDDNILGIHLLEYGDNQLIFHLDYRVDIASAYYWKTFLRTLTRKIISAIVAVNDKKTTAHLSLLNPKTTEYKDFWYYFNHADPKKIALICGDESLSFGELKEKINQPLNNIQNGILRLNPKRDINNIIELLAAWRTGNAVSYHNIEKETVTASGKIAYVAKTSGTAGGNKTIFIPFDALKTLIPDWMSIYKTKDSVHLCLADQRFDVFFGDLLRSLISGETLVLATESERLDAIKISEIISLHKVSHLESTPSFLHYLLTCLSETAPISVIICGSEPIQKGFFNLIQAPIFEQIKFYNSYGLTECSIDSAISELKINSDERFPSGFTVGSQIISIRNQEGKYKVMGSWGEICIEGTCVGYSDTELNQSSYYATGDLGMIIPEDGLIVGGRKNDDFIKVNGRRIPAAFIAHKTSDFIGNKACICFEAEQMAVLFVDGPANKKDILEFLSKFLTKYQLPDDIYNCDHWPVNQNGKADRKKLLEWYKQSRKVNSSWVPNDSTFEKKVYSCLLSKNKPFGAPENSLISFGWNSIDLLSLANEINMRGIFVPVAAFIQNPCIQFLLQSKTAETNATESLEPENYDINDILSILND